jgi:hypothetical protein
MNMNIWALIIVIMLYIYFNIYAVNKCIVIQYIDPDANKNLKWRSLIGKEEALNKTISSFAENAYINNSLAANCDMGSIVANSRITVGIVGCGVIADQHMRFLRSIKNVDVIACCDPNRQAADDFSKKWQIPQYYNDLPSLLNVSVPNSIHLLTPPQFNHELAFLAMSHGCNLFIEKPFTIDSVAARQVFSVAKLHKVIVCVDHNHIFDRVMIDALNVIKNNELGEITWVDSYYGFDLGSNRGNRLMRPESLNHWTFGLPGDRKSVV